MPLESDLTLKAATFDPAGYSEQSAKFNEYLMQIGKAAPKWWEVGAPAYREMRRKGGTALPGRKMLPEGIDIKIPSRENGREIPGRLMYPSSRSSEDERKKCNGVVIHIHGGGWVLGDEMSTDKLLLHYANTGDLAVISVGYRLAPEDPFPAAPEDCQDVAEYLVQNAESQYGGPLKFIGGESAGGHLSLLTTFHLLKTKPDFKLTGLLLHFGAYDLSELPSVKHFQKPLVMDQEIIQHFFDAFVPNMTAEERKNPSISPYYENLEPFRGRLPPAIFTIGTEDPLLDDSVGMATQWVMKGGKAILKIYPNAPHGFIGFAGALKEADEALVDTQTFIKECLGSS